MRAPTPSSLVSTKRTRLLPVLQSRRRHQRRQRVGNLARHGAVHLGQFLFGLARFLFLNPSIDFLLAEAGKPVLFLPMLVLEQPSPGGAPNHQHTPQSPSRRLPPTFPPSRCFHQPGPPI